MRTSLRVILLLAILGGLVVAFHSSLELGADRLMRRYAPCSKPIAYTIGTFDTRFGISKSDFLNVIAEAEAVWERPIGKELFIYSPRGSLTVNLMYDARQETTDALKKLGLVLRDDKASYDELLMQYHEYLNRYAHKKAAYEAQLVALETHQSAYNERVAYWNARGGAGAHEYAKLQEEAAVISQELEFVRASQRGLNDEIATVNAMAHSLNRMAEVLNLNVAQFNEVGGSQGDEFEEGNYQSGPQGESIDIYQFDTRAKLVRVLAHELGHALGLDHVDDPKAIMYRLNQSANEKLTADDLAALKAHCDIE